MVTFTAYETDRKDKIIKFTNCRVLQGNCLVKKDLWISTETGKILHGQDVFFKSRLQPSRSIDLGGKIVSPGFIETQINGAFGFDFSSSSESQIDYLKGVLKIRKKILQFGVTSFLPTITSQRSETYKKVGDSVT
jgi:N-acetylglucosamine-6-phosphate deacetylase